MRAACSRLRFSSKPTIDTSSKALIRPTCRERAPLAGRPCERDEPAPARPDPAGRWPCAGPDNPKARLWNPAGASFEAACASLGLNSGAVAVIGGPQVFTLFLKLGYDRFYLSRAINVRLPGGLPVFSRERFGGDPDETLLAAGLKARPPVWLEDGLTLTDWERE